MIRRKFHSVFLLLILLVICNSLQARVIRVYVMRTEPYMEGKVFGNAGSYVKIRGQIYGEVDPDDPHNSMIQDIQLAPKNKDGNVEYISDYIIIRPADMSKSNGLLFLSLPNRGNAFDADSLLLSRGYIYAWCAWQGDVLKGNDRLLMRVPYAGAGGDEISGIHRTEYQVNTSTKTLNLGSGTFTGTSHHSYETVNHDNSDFTLTKRVLEQDERIPVPNSDWSFSDCTYRRFPGAPDEKKISLKDEFQPGFIYELIYEAKNPLVLGLGFAAIRDFASFIRYETKDTADFPNPLYADEDFSNPVKAAIMQGVSQCSNFSRTFLFFGFNQDEQGRQVFDGLNAHIGVRRIALNIRFARPGGVGIQHEDHLFPGNDPPFSWSTESDPVSGIRGGILEKCLETGTCPKIMQTLSSSEYWQSRASLTTTDSYGTRDLDIPENVRIYLFSGTQHSPADAADQMSGFRTNPNSFAPYHRALLVALEKWVLEGIEPPASAYPTIASGTLVLPDRESTGWPDIPGIPYNGRANELPLLDYGPLYDNRNVSGILTQEPPAAGSDQLYRTLVPAVDRDGNEIAGIRSINVRVPVGTYTGWAIRREGYGRGDLSSLNGMYIPFRINKEERKISKDPRSSFYERYGKEERYLKAVRQAAEDLVREGFLLPEDADTEIARAEQNIP